MSVASYIYANVDNIIKYCQINPSELEMLFSIEKSKEIFDINYAFFIEINNIDNSNNKKSNDRYKRDVFEVRGIKVRVTNDWYPWNIEYFTEYLKQRNIDPVNKPIIKKERIEEKKYKHVFQDDIKEAFSKWMINIEEKKTGTAYNYSNSIDKISQHYTKNNSAINLYKEPNISEIRKLITIYDTGGDYSSFGSKYKRLHINALKTYIRYLESNIQNDNLEFEINEITIEEEPLKTDINSISYKKLINKYTEIIKKYPYPIVTKNVISFLLTILPKTTENWWKNTVLDFLTDEELHNNKKENFDNFDLVPLLNIMIQNFEKIKKICYFNYENRDMIYNMKKVRNHIAHLTKARYQQLDDLLFDFEIIQKFMKLICIGQENINIEIKELQNIKLDIMRDIIQSS